MFLQANQMTELKKTPKPDDSWPQVDWLAGLADGDAVIVKQFWDRYGDTLRRAAERQIAPRLRARVDADDIVQSACRTFFRRFGEGEFDISDFESLWRLLLTITLNKARMQARYHTRDRRSIGREQAIPDLGVVATTERASFLNDVDFDDLLEFVLAPLDEAQRQILVMTLDGRPLSEISNALNCSERTVRRMRGRIREQLRDILKADLE